MTYFVLILLININEEFNFIFVLWIIITLLAVHFLVGVKNFVTGRQEECMHNQINSRIYYLLSIIFLHILVLF